MRLRHTGSVHHFDWHEGDVDREFKVMLQHYGHRAVIFELDREAAKNPLGPFNIVWPKVHECEHAGRFSVDEAFIILVRWLELKQQEAAENSQWNHDGATDTEILGNLLAVLNRDGGHLQAEKGRTHAVLDALGRYYGLIAEDL